MPRRFLGLGPSGQSQIDPLLTRALRPEPIDTGTALVGRLAALASSRIQERRAIEGLQQQGEQFGARLAPLMAGIAAGDPQARLAAIQLVSAGITSEHPGIRQFATSTLPELLKQPERNLQVIKGERGQLDTFDPTTGTISTVRAASPANKVSVESGAALGMTGQAAADQFEVERDASGAIQNVTRVSAAPAVNVNVGETNKPVGTDASKFVLPNNKQPPASWTIQDIEAAGGRLKTEGETAAERQEGQFRGRISVLDEELQAAQATYDKAKAAFDAATAQGAVPPEVARDFSNAAGGLLTAKAGRTNFQGEPSDPVAGRFNVPGPIGNLIDRAAAAAQGIQPKKGEWVEVAPGVRIREK